GKQDAGEVAAGAEGHEDRDRRPRAEEKAECLGHHDPGCGASAARPGPAGGARRRHRWQSGTPPAVLPREDEDEEGEADPQAGEEGQRLEGEEERIHAAFYIYVPVYRYNSETVLRRQRRRVRPR